MINQAIIMGRITAPLEIRQTPAGTAVLQFTVAVDRDYVKQGEERQTDFISCVAWKQTAEFIGRYFGKGRMIALTGRLQSRTYDDRNGTKHYVTELVVNQASFTGEPKQETNGNAPQSGFNNGGYNGTSQVVATANNGNSVDLTDFEDADVISDDGVPF